MAGVRKSGEVQDGELDSSKVYNMFVNLERKNKHLKEQKKSRDDQIAILTTANRKLSDDNNYLKEENKELKQHRKKTKEALAALANTC
jgi:cell division protein FtsB